MHQYNFFRPDSDSDASTQVSVLSFSHLSLWNKLGSILHQLKWGK